jgi:DtxR family Mn-dependent transcriptional regulator
MSRSVQELEKSQPTHTVENYLMTMHVLERDQGEIVAARLADILKVAPATVAMTLKRMERDHWIIGKGRQGGIHLTEAGQASADSVVRRHMLTEWLLLRVLNVPFLQIHAEAHNLEHAMSPLLEERLMDILDNPKVCPHGNPFPGHEEVTSTWLPLSAIPAGERITIRRLHEFAEDNQELLEFLMVNGIVPGAQGVITEVLTFNQTLTLKVGSQPVVLGFLAANSLYGEIG